MNVKKTLQAVVVWYNPTTNKVSLAKCRKTGKFVSTAIAQSLLDAEMNSFRMPTTSMLEVNFIAMMDFIIAAILTLSAAAFVVVLATHASLTVAALAAPLIPAFAVLAAISAEEITC